MEISFCFDKENGIEHFKVNHADVSDEDIYQVFENIYLEFKLEKHTKSLIGHNNDKKFFIIVGIFNKQRDKFKVITAYRAKRKHIILWNQEVNKND